VFPFKNYEGYTPLDSPVVPWFYVDSRMRHHLDLENWEWAHESWDQVAVPFTAVWLVKKI
jgi:hypothetical protein